jgi:hypothetical protein
MADNIADPNPTKPLTPNSGSPTFAGGISPRVFAKTPATPTPKPEPPKPTGQLATGGDKAIDAGAPVEVKK